MNSGFVNCRPLSMNTATLNDTPALQELQQNGTECGNPLGPRLAALIAQVTEARQQMTALNINDHDQDKIVEKLMREVNPEDNLATTQLVSPPNTQVSTENSLYLANASTYLKNAVGEFEASQCLQWFKKFEMAFDSVNLSQCNLRTASWRQI